MTKLVKCQDQNKLVKCQGSNALEKTLCLPRRDDECMIGGASVLPRIIERCSGRGVTLFSTQYGTGGQLFDTSNVAWNYVSVHNIRIPDTSYPYYRELFIQCANGEEHTWDVVSDFGEYNNFIERESERYRSDGFTQAPVRFFNGYNPLLDIGTPGEMGRLTTFGITEQNIYRYIDTRYGGWTQNWRRRIDLGQCPNGSQGCSGEYELLPFSRGYPLIRDCPASTYWCENTQSNITFMDVYDRNQFLGENYKRYYLLQVDCLECPICNAVEGAPYSGILTNGIIRVGRAVCVWDFNGLVDRRIEFNDMLNATVIVKTTGFLSSSGVTVFPINNGFGSWTMNFNNIFTSEGTEYSGSNTIFAYRSFNGGFSETRNPNYDPQHPCDVVAINQPRYQENAPFRMGATVSRIL